MPGKILRLTGMILAITALAACSSLPKIGGSGDVNYAAGSPAGARLSGSDRAALAEAFRAAMESGAPRQWRGGRATGAVTPGPWSLANLKFDPDARIEAARGDFDLAHVMETDLGLYVLARNSNIRIGPGTENKIAEVLSSGSGVEVVGRVINKDWMLISADGKIRGYVFQNLLVKAPGAELELAGGPQRKPVLCRAFTQRLNIYSERAEWAGAACNDGTGWRLAREPQVVEDDDELLGL